MMIREYKDDKKKYIVPALICGYRENNCLPDCIDGWCLIGYLEFSMYVRLKFWMKLQ